MTLLRLGTLLRETRGGRGIREVAEEIGISPATLTRVEGGRLPDIETFRKCCAWLRVSPAEILGLPSNSDQPSSAEGNTFAVAAVHLRAERSLPSIAAHDLAELIVAAHKELARRARGRRTNVSAWL